MEDIKKILDAIFSSGINIIALIVIFILTILALFGRKKWPDSEKLKHYVKQSPSILATVGIFFSFYGISIGLIGLDLKDIQNSIPNLLDGLKVKFIASLMGIFASIIVRIAQSFSVEDTVVEVDTEHQMVALLQDIKSILSAKEENSPDNLLQELKQTIAELPPEFRKQSELLNSIKSSLAGDGDASVTTQLAKVRIDMKDALKELDVNNQKRGAELNDKIATGFNGMAQKFEEFAKVLAENNSKAFIEALENAMRDFNNNITEQFGENFKELNRAVGALLTWQDNYKNHVEQLTSNFMTALQGVQALELAFSEIKANSQSFSTVSAELSGILQKLDVQLQDLNTHLKALSQVADNAKDAFPVIEDNLTKLTAGFKKSTEQSLAAINSTVDEVGEDLKETTSRLKDTTGKLRDSMEGQRTTLEETSQDFKTVVDSTLKNLAKDTKTSIENYGDALQKTVTQQLDSIDTNIKNSNKQVNDTIQNASYAFEQSINAMTETMGNAITDASSSFKKSIQNTADDFDAMAKMLTKSIDTQEQTLKGVSQDVKATIERTLRELTEQSKASIKEYESSLHAVITSQSVAVNNAISSASKEFNRLLTDNTTKSTSVLEQQTQLLDKALQEELKKAIETMGKHLAALSNQFVQDYRPLTEKLKEVVKLAKDLERGR